MRDWARRRGTPVWVRLVKGAYWDYETVHAAGDRLAGARCFSRSGETDANFERQTRFVMRNHEQLRPALGSHNVRSLAHGIAVARHLGLPKTAFELQMLYGMADAEKQALVELGHRLRIYMPYGELIPGMAYLVRRLLENTSNDSFLRASFLRRRLGRRSCCMNPLFRNRHRQERNTAVLPKRWFHEHQSINCVSVPQRAAGRFRPGREPAGDARRARAAYRRRLAGRIRW